MRNLRAPKTKNNKRTAFPSSLHSLHRYDESNGSVSFRQIYESFAIDAATAAGILALEFVKHRAPLEGRARVLRKKDPRSGFAAQLSMALLLAREVVRRGALPMAAGAETFHLPLPGLAGLVPWTVAKAGHMLSHVMMGAEPAFFRRLRDSLRPWDRTELAEAMLLAEVMMETTDGERRSQAGADRALNAALAA